MFISNKVGGNSYQDHLESELVAGIVDEAPLTVSFSCQFGYSWLVEYLLIITQSHQVFLGSLNLAIASIVANSVVLRIGS